MAKYTVKRLLYSALILFFVMFLIYVLMYNMPMGYIETKARELASRPGASKSYSEWQTFNCILCHTISLLS